MADKSIIITGPTAAGKTSLATKLCRKISGEIISADSRQVYKGLDIGTGKDLSDYISPTPVTHHMIDIRQPMEDFSLYDWRLHYAAYHRLIRKSGNIPVICGGTPLYLDMILKNYLLKGDKSRLPDESIASLSLDQLTAKLKKEHPEIATTTDLSQKQRILRAFEIAASENKIAPLPECDFLIIAPYWHRKVIHQKVALRLKERWEALKSEVVNLLDQGVTHERLEWFGLEYRYISHLIRGMLTEAETFERLLIKIRQFAKRQDIWFRKIEKSGFTIHWLEEEDKLGQAEKLVELFLANQALPSPKLKISDIVYGPRTQ